MKYKFNQNGVCLNPKIVWRGVYNTFGGKTNTHPLYGVSFVSVARRGDIWLLGYSVGTQDWMHIAGCGSINGKYRSEKEATIAGLMAVLDAAKRQIIEYYPCREEKERLRSLIADVSEAIFEQRQLTLF